jgi:hypothetical protein
VAATAAAAIAAAGAGAMAMASSILENFLLPATTMLPTHPKRKRCRPLVYGTAYLSNLYWMTTLIPPLAQNMKVNQLGGILWLYLMTQQLCGPRRPCRRREEMVPFYQYLTLQRKKHQIVNQQLEIQTSISKA